MTLHPCFQPASPQFPIPSPLHINRGAVWGVEGSRFEAWMKSHKSEVACYNITFICTPTRKQCRLSPEMNTSHISKQTTCLCRDTGGKGTLPAQRTSFNTLDNWGHKTPTQSKKDKGQERKVKRSWPKTPIQYTRLHIYSTVLCSQAKSLCSCCMWLILKVGWVLFYVHRNCRLITIRDGSPGWPPRLSHSSWALIILNEWLLLL